MSCFLHLKYKYLTKTFFELHQIITVVDYFIMDYSPTLIVTGDDDEDDEATRTPRHPAQQAPSSPSLLDSAAATAVTWAGQENTGSTGNIAEQGAEK